MRLELPIRDGRHDRLRELYRATEEASDSPSEADAQTLLAFIADRALIADLRRVAASSGPVAADQARARLLTAVALKRSEAAAPARPLRKKVVQKRAVALAGAAVLFAGAVAGATAGGGVSSVAGNVGDVLEALQVVDGTPDVADEHIDEIEQPDRPEGATGLDNATDQADEHAEDGLDTAAEGGENADDGIQNASPTGLENAGDPAVDGPEAGAPDDVDPQPAEPGDNPADPPETHLPDQADDEASDGADNASDQAKNGDVDLPDEVDDHADLRIENAHLVDVSQRGG